MTHSTRTDTHPPYRDGDRDWRDAATRYALLPLRVFLGVTFIYAGLDELTDSSFFADAGSGSVGDLMRTVRDSSAIPALVDLALKNPPASATPSPSVNWPSASARCSDCSPGWRPSAAR